MNAKNYFLIISALCCIFFIEACTHSGAVGQKETVVYESPEQMVALAKERTTSIEMEEFKKIYGGEDYFILLDVRTITEYENGYIPGAVSIPRGVLEFRIGSESVWDNFGLYIPEKNDPIIIYCKSGNRSVLAAETLQELGYTNVKYLEGGWTQWHETYPELIEKIAVEETGSGAMISGSGNAGGC